MKLITGNTYPVRGELRALGGNWNKATQGWEMPDEKAAEAEELVQKAPPSRAPSRSSGRYRHGYQSTVTRFSSGATIYRNRNGRCEDAPCCGCCS